MSEGFSHFGVIGAGAWGTALAQVLASDGTPVTLWSWRAEQAADLAAWREHRDKLPGIALHSGISPTHDGGVLSSCDAVLYVAPAQSARDVLTALGPHIGVGVPVISCSKGFERGTLKSMADVLGECVPHARRGVLSGPSFAHEVASGLPAAVTLAAETMDLANGLALAMARPSFRLYTSDDVVGAEIGGAIKNVLAIACGIVDGKGLGKSAHAGLITRGFAEMARLARAMGARSDTLHGLSGLGDLVLTCSSAQSRNMAFGRQLGQGVSMRDLLGAGRGLTEGVASAPSVVALGDRFGVEVPICAAVNAILSQTLSVDGAIDALLSRPIKAEPV